MEIREKEVDGKGLMWIRYQKDGKWFTPIIPFELNISEEQKQEIRDKLLTLSNS